MIELIRAIVRPALALIAGAGTVYFVGLAMRTGATIPGEWWGFTSAIVTFYFLHRHDEKKGNQ